MRLRSLSLQNFRQHRDTQIAFESGLTGIIGANGSGKSTILEAIAWAIYGTAAARGNRDSIRSLRAPAGAPVKVELEFDLGAHRYRVERGLSVARLFLDGAAQPIAMSVAGVTELLQKRLGMSRQEFFNTYFTGQKELSVMASLGPRERALFLSRVLGYERLGAAQRIARDQRTAIDRQLAGLKQGMADRDQVLAQLRAAESRLTLAQERERASAERRRAATAAAAGMEPRWEAAQRQREAARKVDSELRVIEATEQSLQRDLARLDRERAEVDTARGELQKYDRDLAPLEALTMELKRLDVLHAEEGRRAELEKQQVRLVEDVARLVERRAKIEAARAREGEYVAARDAKQAELRELEQRVVARREEWVKDRQEAETQRETLRQQYEEFQEQRGRLIAAGEDGDCPTCTRPLGEQYGTVLELLDRQIETVTVNGKYYKARLEQLAHAPAEIADLEERRRAAAADLTQQERTLARLQQASVELDRVAAELDARERQRAELERGLAEIPPGYDRARHDAVRAELDRLQRLRTKAERCRAQVDREPRVLKERDDVVYKLHALRTRLTDIRTQREKAPFSEADFEDLRRAYERAASERREAELAAVAAEGEVSAAHGMREMAERQARELAERERALVDLSSTRRLHDELDRAYGDLRTDLNAEMRPELSELASNFLSELTDGRYTELEIDENYTVTAVEEGIPKPVISGGEEDLANLVLRLAISQMIAERAGQPLSLLILDEIFGSLDEMRRANVVGLLRRLQDRFEQVILITHIDAVREGLDQVIAVRYDEAAGTSIVVQQEQEPAGALVGAGGDDSLFGGADPSDAGERAGAAD